ncbi:hypothetical protein ACWEO6_23405 [Streptomyces sp. NPDC004291]
MSLDLVKTPGRGRPAVGAPKVSVDAEAGAVRDAASGDDRFGALGPDEAAVLVVVVAPVGSSMSDRRRGQPTRLARVVIFASRGIGWVTSLRSPPVSDTASGLPCPSNAAGTDPRLALEALIAPLHSRALMSREPLEDELPRALADLVLDGLADWNADRRPPARD